MHYAEIWSHGDVVRRPDSIETSSKGAKNSKGAKGARKFEGSKEIGGESRGRPRCRIGVGSSNFTIGDGRETLLMPDWPPILKLEHPTPEPKGAGKFEGCKELAVFEAAFRIGGTIRKHLACKYLDSCRAVKRTICSLKGAKNAKSATEFDARLNRKMGALARLP